MGKVLAEKLREETGVVLEWRNMEIHPDTPPEGRAITELFPEVMVRQMFERLNSMGKQYGINYVSNNKLSNSRRAIILGEYILTNHPAQEDAYHEAVFRAYFTQGLDIGDTAVLEKLTAQIGLDPKAVELSAEDSEALARVEQNAKEAQAEGVTGTPTFLVGRERVVGAQPYPVLLEAARRALKE